MTLFQRRQLLKMRARQPAQISDHQIRELSKERAADWCFVAIFALIVLGAILKLTGVLS